MKRNKSRGRRALVIELDCVKEYEELEPTARRILRLYATWTDHLHVAHFTQQTTADELGRARCTVHAAVRELVKRGFLTQLAHGQVRVNPRKVRVLEGLPLVEFNPLQRLLPWTPRKTRGVKHGLVDQEAGRADDEASGGAQ